ncbi:MAG: hypothetical protein QXX08_07295 [Candidatus Bathyarchaeia archaeon]
METKNKYEKRLKQIDALLREYEKEKNIIALKVGDVDADENPRLKQIEEIQDKLVEEKNRIIGGGEPDEVPPESLDPKRKKPKKKNEVKENAIFAKFKKSLKDFNMYVED